MKLWKKIRSLTPYQPTQYTVCSILDFNAIEYEKYIKIHGKVMVEVPYTF